MTALQSPSVTLTRWRTGLIIVGVLLLVFGGYTMVETVQPVKIWGLITWFVFALILHDGVIAGITFGVAFLLRKNGRRVPVAVLGIIQGALIVMAIFAITVVPEVYKKSIGTKNATVLPLDYGPALIFFWIGIGVTTIIVIAGYYAWTRRQKNRPSVSQE